MKTLFVPANKKSVNAKDREITAWASRAIIDRDDEVILGRAWMQPNSTRAFELNPVLLASHDYNSLPIGKVTKLEKSNDGLSFKAKFAKTAAAEEAWTIVRDLGLAAFSVGFIPKAYEELTPGDAQKHGYDISGLTKDRIKVYTDIELLEISLVAVPANPRATAVGAAYADGKIKNRELALALKSWKDDEIIEVVDDDEISYEEARRVIEKVREYCQGANFQKKIREQFKEELEIALAKITGKVI